MGGLAPRGRAVCRAGMVTVPMCRSASVPVARSGSIARMGQGTGEPDWWHLQRVIDALVLGGNETTDGMLSNQGGFDCYMREPLDVSVIEGVLADDARRASITVTESEVFCRHCWASIHGPTRG